MLEVILVLTVVNTLLQVGNLILQLIAVAQRAAQRAATLRVARENGSGGGVSRPTSRDQEYECSH
jgi:hypothetical protein